METDKMDDWCDEVIATYDELIKQWHEWYVSIGAKK